MACRYRFVFLVFVVTGFSAGSGCDGDSPQTPEPAEQTPPGACSGAEGDECAELTAITASVDQRSDIVPKEVRDDVVVFDFPELGANGERPDILMDGRIVAGGVTRAGTPFLRKIESCIIDKARKEIVCQTSVPRLEETFENVTISRRLRVRKDGHLPRNKPDSHDSLLSIGTSFDCAFDLVDETREGENGQTTIYIGLPNCEIAVGLDLILNLEIKRAKLQSAEIALEGSLGLDIDALASIDASYEWGEEKLLGGVTLANITFAIGIVPVNIQITFDTYAGYNATFDGLASVEAGVDALYTAKFGVAYDGTDWNKIGEVKAETTPWKNVTLETEVTAGLWIRPEFSVLLYGTMGPTLSAKASLTGSFKADNCEMVGTTGGDVAKAGYEYTVDLGLDIEMGGKIEFLSWEKSFDLQLASFTKNLLSGADSVDVGDCCKASDCYACAPSVQMVCNSNRCEETPISGGDGLETAVFADCCANAGDCDDGDEWTVDTCGEQQIAYGGALGESVTRMACLHELKKGAQCEIDAACDDSNDCTTDTCVQDATFGKRCQFMEISGCESCTSAEDCDDGDVCTLDTCTNQKCQYSGSVATSVQDGCCVSDEGCDTGDPCTPMACQNFQCVQLLELTNCCTSASDCDDNDDTTMNRCIDNSCDFSKSVPTEKFTSGTVATGPAQSARAM